MPYSSTLRPARRSLFDWNFILTKFQLRVGAYLLLLTDTYPSTDAEQGVHLGRPYPDPTKDLKVGLPLVKWFLAIPHYVVLAFLLIGVVGATIISWFAILFTGRYPRSLFKFVVDVIRWCVRVSAYAFLLLIAGGSASGTNHSAGAADEDATSPR